ncbi:MFS transporter [Actinacidiphila acidipaludis]|uniref:MFS transporter n=1 Tax=Actinacidiphila acidipaludis TaxID=2873382 RepID=A0ABS7QFX6_9ACTN|nr:MFS transporter [Streptomyces acidipaludis]MBY8882065.1 MFS transporter [Streptomyces acidipaludis]
MRRGLGAVPKAVRLLAAGSFANMVVSYTFVYLVLYLTGPRGLPVAQAGLVAGAGGAGLVAGNFTGGWFGDRHGHRRTLVAAAAVSGTGLICLPLLPVAGLLLVLPVAQYAAGAVRASNSALVAVSVPEGARRQAYAVMRFAANAGFTLGPPLGALLAARLSYGWLFVLDGAGTLGFAAYAARILPGQGGGRGAGRPAAAAAGEAGAAATSADGAVAGAAGPFAGAAGPSAGGAEPVGAASDAARPGTGVAGPGAGDTRTLTAPGRLFAELRARPAVLALLAAVVVTDTVYRQQYSTLPVYLSDHGFPAAFYGALLAVNGGVILCLEIPVTLALRRAAPLRIIATGLGLVGLGYGALVLGASTATALALMVLLTAGEILYKTPATAYVADHSPPGMEGRFQSLYAGASVAGTVLAPPLGSALYAAAPAALWPVCAALALAASLGLSATRTARRRAPLPHAEPSPAAAVRR